MFAPKNGSSSNPTQSVRNGGPESYRPDLDEKVRDGHGVDVSYSEGHTERHRFEEATRRQKVAEKHDEEMAASRKRAKKDTEEDLQRRQAAQDGEIGARTRAEAKLEQARKQADAEAIKLTVIAGGTFDPDCPSVDDVIGVKDKPLEVIAVENHVPYVASDIRVTMSDLIANFITAGVSVIVGNSAAIAAGLVDAGQLVHSPCLALGASLAGAVFAVPTKTALAGCWHLVGQQSTLDEPCGKSVAIAATLSAFLFGVDVAVEHAGLLALHNQALLPFSVDPIDAYLVPTLVTSGFVIATALAGFFHGRFDGLTNRLQKLQREDCKKRRDARMAEDGVPEAISAVHVCNQLRWEIAKIRSDRATLTKEWSQEQQRLSTLVQALSHSDTSEQLKEARLDRENAQKAVHAKEEREKTRNGVKDIVGPLTNALK